MYGSLRYSVVYRLWYIGVAPAEDRASTSTGFTGTLMRNSGPAKRLYEEADGNGDVDFKCLKRHHGATMNDLSVLITIHKPQMVMGKTYISEKSKPTAMLECKKYTGGVDHSDQMVAYNCFHRKTMKWWKKLAFYLLSFIMVQAHSLYVMVRKIVGRPGMSLEDFVISVVEDLLIQLSNDEYQPTESIIEQQPVQPGMLRLEGKYYLIPLENKMYCHICYHRLREEVQTSDYSRRNTLHSNYVLNM